MYIKSYNTIYYVIYYVTPTSLLRKYYNLLRNSYVVTPQILQFTT